jgi:hypothetical protein
MARFLRERQQISAPHRRKKAVSVMERSLQPAFFAAAAIVAGRGALPCLVMRQPDGYGMGGGEAMPSSSTALRND